MMNKLKFWEKKDEEGNIIQKPKYEYLPISSFKMGFNVITFYADVIANLLMLVFCLFSPYTQVQASVTILFISIIVERVLQTFFEVKGKLKSPEDCCISIFACIFFFDYAFALFQMIEKIFKTKQITTRRKVKLKFNDKLLKENGAKYLKLQNKKLIKCIISSLICIFFSTQVTLFYLFSSNIWFVFPLLCCFGMFLNIINCNEELYTLNIPNLQLKDNIKIYIILIVEFTCKLLAWSFLAVNYNIIVFVIILLEFLIVWMVDMMTNEPYRRQLQDMKNPGGKNQGQQIQNQVRQFTGCPWDQIALGALRAEIVVFYGRNEDLLIAVIDDWQPSIKGYNRRQKEQQGMFFSIKDKVFIIWRVVQIPVLIVCGLIFDLTFYLQKFIILGIVLTLWLLMVISVIVYFIKASKGLNYQQYNTEQQLKSNQKLQNNKNEEPKKFKLQDQSQQQKSQQQDIGQDEIEIEEEPQQQQQQQQQQPQQQKQQYPQYPQQNQQQQPEQQKKEKKGFGDKFKGAFSKKKK